MMVLNCRTFHYAVGLLLLVGSTAQAGSLSVNCGAKSGLTSIGAALKALQYSESHGPTTISVSGACHENVVIQSTDRLTLTAAVKGTSVSDASGGKLTVIDIEDSRDVAINGFTINAGSGSDVNGIVCGDYSTCRLSGNIIQGAGNGGFALFTQAQATLDGDILQNNGGAGLLVRSGSTVRAGLRPFTSRNNGQGINIGRHAFTYGVATVEHNSDAGVIAQEQSTIDLTGSISSNGSRGVDVREGSVARFLGATITGNAAEGVLVHDLSMVTFGESTVTGNGGVKDVVCAPQYSLTRGTATDINGGTTNCVEP